MTKIGIHFSSAPFDRRLWALRAFAWNFGIPAGAVRLAGSSAYRNQAFRFGEMAYGVQFHVEVTDPMLAEWQHVPAYAKSAELILGVSGFQRLAADFAAARASMARSASLMFTGWLDQAARDGEQAARRRGGIARPAKAS